MIKKFFIYKIQLMIEISDIVKYAKICNQSYFNEKIDKYLEYNYAEIKHLNNTDVLILKNKEEICFAFRGTDNREDVKKDALFLKKKFIVGNNYLGKVHMGFLQYFNEAKNDLIKILEIYIRENPEFKKIIFTGHSLGASIVLFGLYVFITYPHLQSKINITTFASPRIGNSKFKKNCDKLLGDKLLRVVNPTDLVTDLPPVFLCYRHTNNILLLSKKQKFQSLKNFFNILKNTFGVKNFQEVIFNNIDMNHSVNTYIELINKESRNLLT